jgi:hypothetical protein
VRKSYLESYYNLIPVTQQARLLKIIQNRVGETGADVSTTESQAQLVQLIAQLKKPLGNPMIQLRKVLKYAKMSSKDYNNTMDESYVDLGALFVQNNKIAKTIKIHELINDAFFTDINSSINKLENDIMVHKIIKENKSGITDVVFNSFYKNDNTSVDPVYSAQMDTFTNSVKLPRGIDQSSLSVQGLAMADIALTHFGGGIRGMLEDEDHTKERAIDGDSTTFWAEVILTDEPIRQVYDGETYFGAMCEIMISLFRSDLINHIHLDPFSNYPVSIVKIYYSETEAGAWIDLGITPQSSTTMMEFNFNEVLAKRVKFVINQRNPSINSYRIPKRVVNNANMWQQIINREYSLSTETSTPIQATQDMVDYITGWQTYLDATKTYADKLKVVSQQLQNKPDSSNSEQIFDATTQEIAKAGTNEMIDPLKLDLYGKPAEPQDELIEVRKYEYVYGAYEIDIKKIWYMERGEYISPMYAPNGTVMEASLDAVDVIPSGASIEYQVATRANDWRNVLPSGGYITGERILIDSNTLTGNLRFPCRTALDSVKRNSLEIPSADWDYNSNGAVVTIASGWYTGTSSYVVNYMPDGVTDVIPSGVVVSFADDVLQGAVEVFEGSTSRQYKVSLEHFPFVDYAIVNDTSKAGKGSPNFSYENGRWYNFTPGEVSGIPSGEFYDIITLTVDGFEATNRTDYYNGETPALAAYNDVSYPYYEYIHSGKSLYINTPIYQREIKVKYNFLNDFIQLRAILRNNDRGNVSRTPIIESVTLKMRTI